MLSLNKECNNIIEIKKHCNNNHTYCKEIALKYKNSINELTQINFNNYITMIKSGIYNCCISNYHNNHASEIKNFIISCSSIYIINSWDNLINNILDDELLKIIKNQILLDNNFIKKILNLDNITTNYSAKLNFINALISYQPYKLKSFEFIILDMNLNDFSKYLNKMNKQINNNIENIVIKYINKNSLLLQKKENIEISTNIINNFISKSEILKHIYKLIYNFIDEKFKLEVFNKSIISLDKELILLLLENKDIKPNIDTVNKLVEKCYCRSDGAIGSTQVAEIIDLLCDYGLVINKTIVIKLLQHGCYINNLEKHNIIVDQEILGTCSNNSYYPYKFETKPNLDILKKECSKSDNILIIKKLKEFGGEYTTECLAEACKIKKNGKVIKYLINECNVKSDNQCLINFQESYGLEALDSLMKNYTLTTSTNLQEKPKTIELDKNSVMNIIPRNIKLDKNNEVIEYKLKSKINTFFNFNKKNITYNELYQNILIYLINNNLVIGNYFIINEKISNLLKINHCIIMHIEEIHNMLTYFIDLIK